MRRRQTLAGEVRASGVGLHSGEPARLTLRPAPPGAGIVFLADVAGQRVEVPARAQYVVSSRQATVLGRHGGRVATVEHLLAALYGLGVDDVLAELEGEEVPALDGSAANFVSLVSAAGLAPHGGAVEPLRVGRLVEVQQGSARARVEPAEELALRLEIDFEHPAVGRQALELPELGAARFCEDVAPARTFGFLRDAEALRDAGLARGASLGNTLVFGEQAALNPEGPRWPDEPARHKALDLLGDLALLGRPLRGRVHVERGGHALHHALVNALVEAAS